MSLLWSHDRVTNFNVPYQAFPQLNYLEQVYVVTNQLLEEGSVTQDLSHSINIVTLRDLRVNNLILYDKSPCHTTIPATNDKCPIDRNWSNSLKLVHVAVDYSSSFNFQLRVTGHSTMTWSECSPNHSFNF